MSHGKEAFLQILFSSCFREKTGPDKKGKDHSKELEEQKYAARIEEYLKGEKQAFEKRRREISVIMLGSSDSGKSTLLKQMKILHGNGFSPQERAAEKRRIRSACLLAVITLLDLCAAARSEQSQSEASKEDVLEKYHDLYQINEQFANGSKHELESDYVLAFQNAWLEPDIQMMFAKSNQVHESTPYFMEKLTSLFSVEYSPSDDDILNLRTATRMVSDNQFTFNQRHILHIIDVAGQYHSRKTWIPYFDDVTSIIFIASLSSYDQTMAENTSVNRMVDSISLFQEMSNHELLLEKPFILILNKKDLFEKKIKNKHITDYFPTFKGPKGDVSAGAKFFESKFKEANTSK